MAREIVISCWLNEVSACGRTGWALMQVLVTAVVSHCNSSGAGSGHSYGSERDRSRILWQLVLPSHFDRTRFLLHDTAHVAIRRIGPYFALKFLLLRASTAHLILRTESARASVHVRARNASVHVRARNASVHVRARNANVHVHECACPQLSCGALSPPRFAAGAVRAETRAVVCS
eukprot:580992-Pleurochrysis_carterae.AAC.2